MLKFIFRADASLEIGTGHIMRCLSLAEGLRKSGSCIFICRDLQGNLSDLIKRRGFKVIKLPPIFPKKKVPTVSWGKLVHTDSIEDANETIASLEGLRADWIIVDHYSLDAAWEMALRGSSHKLMVIDDLANRQHDCDLLLDQTLGRLASDYQPLVPSGCELKLGPRFALLDSRFSKLRPISLARRAGQNEVKRLLISLGGSDKDGVTKQVLDSLSERVNLPADALIKIVLGKYAPDLDLLRKRATCLPWRTEVLVDIDTMPFEIANSDLVIGAGGISSWERACLGAPSLVIPVAENQSSNIRALEESGSCISVKKLDSGKLDSSDFIAKLNEILKPNVIASVRQASYKITEGNGVDLIANYLVNGK
ncbi:UDP-2,4-diacetamido-2,4,6-trideoxy-beta-L-altropyranose hydrolase [Polynucleobacter paneuropaeus]|uniref:UDP-2,4-diacetamido-2,4, 6-trideoxy-beta-L-altropyranose hydrolase n=1 Tax=Polynucleobacter paneuropaeus TaxID=2527775 RepID=A0A9Q2ZX65_9BURK|nr:UDP-2,4-diacetamido-2,4,6-trideoxy-beta-L-altropyranose hydrolase [Polynucleobacter paneuropaeus]